MEVIDLHLALWFMEAVRLRLEREGLTPGVREAFADARGELDRALDGLGIAPGRTSPRLELVEGPTL
jgi:hypothetical protein